MRFVIFLCLLFFESLSSTLPDFNFEGTLPLNDRVIIVSLGSGCDTALKLRDYGLRNAAFPFDWLITGSHEKFILVLRNDFQFFADPNFFIPVDEATDHPNNLRNTYYDISFWHEGSTLYDWSDLEKYQEQLERVQAKYERRIERFRQLRFFLGKVFFVRNFTSATREQAHRHPELAVELREALRQYFPQLDFTLVIVTYNDVQGTPIENLDQIVEFRMERGPWHTEYGKMYETLLRTETQK